MSTRVQYGKCPGLGGTVSPLTKVDSVSFPEPRYCPETGTSSPVLTLILGKVIFLSSFLASTCGDKSPNTALLQRRKKVFGGYPCLNAFIIMKARIRYRNLPETVNYNLSIANHIKIFTLNSLKFYFCGKIKENIKTSLGKPDLIPQ